MTVAMTGDGRQGHWLPRAAIGSRAVTASDRPSLFTALVVAFQSAACASTAADSRTAAFDAGAATVDAPLTADVPAAIDVGVDAPPAAEVPASPVAFALFGGIAPADGPLVNLTFFDDGAVRSGYAPDPRFGALDRSYRLPGGAAEVARLRREFEAAGLLGVPEISDESVQVSKGVWRFAYVDRGRVYRWTFFDSDDTPPALHGAVAAIVRATYLLER